MRILRTVRLHSGAVLAALLLGVMLAGCGEDPDPEPGPPPPPPDLADLVSFVALDDANGTVRFFNNLFDVFVRDFDANIDEGIVLDRLANGYRNGLVGGSGTVRTLCRLPLRDATTGTSFDPAMRDRSITGGTTTLQTPKGSAIARIAGRLIVADNGSPGSDIKVYSTTAGGNVAPVFTQATSEQPWDVAYDEGSDTLFAALTNGDIARFDDFLAMAGAATETTFRPSTALAISNMHGIDYDSANDRLVVSDVAAASEAQGMDFATDGSIYVFTSASTRSGTVAPARTLRGDATRLGNPVDLVLLEQATNPGVFDLGVAEKANNLLLTFTNIFTGSGLVDEAPASSRGQAAPESVALRTPADQDFTANFSTTDLDFDVALDFVFSTDTQAPDNISRMDPGLTGAMNFFTADFTNTTLQNIVLGLDGDAFISFDDNNTGNGGLAIINRLNLRSGGIDNPNLDRFIRGTNVNLVNPKGLDVVDFFGVVMVADIKDGAMATQGTVQVYSTCAAADAAPLFTTTLPLINGVGVKPWDLDYDPFNDRLFVAATNGTVLVYDDYLETQPDSQAPNRTITPTVGGAPASVNLHGIQYVLFGEDGNDIVFVDQLILSDVGSAASDTDGQIFVINNGDGANGNTEVARQIVSGANPLGNPVDIAFDGSRLYVADKANDVIYRIPGIINPANFGTGQALNPDAQIMRSAPESISLSPTYLP